MKTTMPFDPIRHFYKKNGLNHSLIKDVVIGEKYAAVMLNDGRIGVCATLEHEVEKVVPGFSPSLSNITHRIVLNAYYNALYNYDINLSGQLDIFEAVDFQQYQQVVMIGYFRSLFKKFSDAGIAVKVFDMMLNDEALCPMNEMYDTLPKANALVISATTIFNNTFKAIIDAVPKQCDIFLLGPSTIMHTDMFKYTNINIMFGAVFKPHDKAVLNIIKEGYGTPEFSERMKKVFVSRNGW